MRLRERLVGFVRHDVELVHRLIEDAHAILIDRQAQPASDLLALLHRARRLVEEILAHRVPDLEPMITRSEWERVQALLGAPDNPRPQRHAFPYIGLLHCGTCGCAITADAHVKPSGKRFVYYHCTRKNRDVPCVETPISEAKLTETLAEFASEIGQHADFARWAFSRLARMADTDRTAHERSVASLESEVAARVRKRDALIDMRMRDILTDEEFLQRKNALAAEEGRLTQQLAEIQTRPSTWVELCENAFSLVNEAKLRFDEGTDEEKRLLLKSLGLNWRLTAGKPLCSLQKPFSLFPKSDEIPVWSG